MLARCVEDAQLDWDLVSWADKTFWISKCVQNYFWSQVSANVGINFKIPYKGSCLDEILIKNVLFLGKHFFCKGSSELKVEYLLSLMRLITTMLRVFFSLKYFAEAYERLLMHTWESNTTWTLLVGTHSII